MTDFIVWVMMKISPKLREEVIEAVERLDEVAKGTDSKIDDILVALLKIAIGIE